MVCQVFHRALHWTRNGTGCYGGGREIPWGNVRHITPQCGLENPNAPMFASASVWHDLGHRTAVHIEGRVLRGG
jgi:hypothetical protein